MKIKKSKEIALLLIDIGILFLSFFACTDNSGREQCTFGGAWRTCFARHVATVLSTILITIKTSNGHPSTEYR
ncbi:hypothetical protein ACO0K9_20360 [Undibacterium sp. Ji50W]|uniref:hypothetical protein n=1 Tax=Undibacterium sp. Ji50W TaxID=3413041 RepID=UPI003BF2DE78